MADWLKAVILGIVEGVTEFLPISSTGHLIVASSLLDFQTSAGETFEIFIQLGAVIAVLFYYRSELWQQARDFRRDAGAQRLWMAVVIAFLPAAAIGFLLRDWIKDVLFSPTVVAISLIVGGVVFLLVERFARLPAVESSVPTPDAVKQITPRQALLIGLAQTIALIPGVSRSGASIVGGMLTGLQRSAATQFSFFLAIPTLGLATIVDLLLSLDEISSGDWLYLIIGLVVSCIVAWLSIGWLLRYVSRHTFIPFGYYRILAGLVILVLVFMGRL